MAVKRRAEGEMAVGAGADASECYEMDWWAVPRRPFRRGFVPYGAPEAAASVAAKRRRTLGVELVEDPVGEDLTPPPLESFEELGVLPPWLLEALRDEDPYEPTPLQAQMLPIALAGQNLVAVSATGEQAAAYLLAAAIHAEDQAPLLEDEPGPIVLVLVPTPERATAVAEEATSLLRHSGHSVRHPEGLRAVSVCGAGTRSEKLKQLGPRGSHILVGTPKRLHDMVSKEQISFLRVTLLVLDGADRMLDLNLAQELRELASWVRPERQTLVLSATWPRPLHEFAHQLCYSGGSPVRFAVRARQNSSHVTSAISGGGLKSGIAEAKPIDACAPTKSPAGGNKAARVVNTTAGRKSQVPATPAVEHGVAGDASTADGGEDATEKRRAFLKEPADGDAGDKVEDFPEDW